MILSRTGFFALLFLIIVAPVASYKLWWVLGSQTTTGNMRFVGKGSAGMLALQYSVIRYQVGGDTLWLQSPDNLIFERGEPVPVRYRRNNPADARVDSFAGCWLETLLMMSPFVLFVLICFLHPDLVPQQARIALTPHRPYIQLV